MVTSVTILWLPALMAAEVAALLWRGGIPRGFRFYLWTRMLVFALWFAWRGSPEATLAIITLRWLAIANPLLQAPAVIESLYLTRGGRLPVYAWMFCWLIGASLGLWLVAQQPQAVPPLSRAWSDFRAAGHVGLAAALITSLALIFLLRWQVYAPSWAITHQVILCVYLIGSCLGDLPRRIVGWSGSTLASELVQAACLAAWITTAPAFVRARRPLPLRPIGGVGASGGTSVFPPRTIRS